MKDKTRLEYLDAAKGLGILLVILGHIYAWNPNINRKILVTWIYSFHMPLFFIVSGMLIKYKNYCNIKEFIFSRIKHILAGLFHELSMGRSNLLHPCYHISHIVSDSLVM